MKKVFILFIIVFILFFGVGCKQEKNELNSTLKIFYNESISLEKQEAILRTENKLKLFLIQGFNNISKEKVELICSSQLGLVFEDGEVNIEIDENQRSVLIYIGKGDFKVRKSVVMESIL